ncbi:hypothetical protein J1N35_027450 [Gossypium stocksii]|uniref:Uncharacterized protein n=1 Tax=Gossypium stocksii TaxID=47602 RepID=A0A9D3ZZ51_9ROSI|nr:hypothetical protein J1N35_027450 [Gossypium stocksii]
MHSLPNCICENRGSFCWATQPVLRVYRDMIGLIQCSNLVFTLNLLFPPRNSMTALEEFQLDFQWDWISQYIAILALQLVITKLKFYSSEYDMFDLSGT